MDKDKQESIKHVMQSAGWFEMEKILKNDILESKRPAGLKTDGRYEDIAINAIARNKAAKIVERWISKMHKLAQTEQFKKQSYK